MKFQFSTFTEHSAHILGDSSLVAYQLQWPTKPCGALSPIALDSFFVAFSFPDRHRNASSSSLIPCITYDRLGHKQTETGSGASNSGVVPLTPSPQQDNILATSKKRHFVRPRSSEEAVIYRGINLRKSPQCDARAIAIQGAEERAADRCHSLRCGDTRCRLFLTRTD